MNITTYDCDLKRYRDAKDLADFTEKFGLDGLEVMPGAETPAFEFLPGQVTGVHMRCTNDWLDLWTGNTEALNREYGNEQTWTEVFGGKSREVLLERAREDLAYAKKVGAQYVVFHICNIRTTDIFTGTFDYTDEEVIEVSAEFINELLDGEEPSLYFLAENLWWPGMRFTDPDLTRRLLNLIHYEKKGIMLDTGHLLHTNLELETQEEAVTYILSMLKKHGDLVKEIRGIHLQQSLTGVYVKNLLESRCVPPADYEERFRMSMEHVFAIDSHEPFTDSRVTEILEMVNAKYVTLEYISESREQHAAKLSAGAAALGWI